MDYYETLLRDHISVVPHPIALQLTSLTRFGTTNQNGHYEKLLPFVQRIAFLWSAKAFSVSAPSV